MILYSTLVGAKERQSNQTDIVMKGGLKMDKLHEVSDEKKELKRCDNCKHEKEPWTNGCADCFDYELWEAKDDSNK